MKKRNAGGFFNRLKIQTQLLMLTSASILLMLAILYVTYVQSIGIIQDNNAKFLEQGMNHISVELNAKCDAIEKTAFLISFYSVTQDFILETDAESKYENGKDLSSYLLGETAIDDSILDVTVIPNDGSAFDLSGYSKTVTGMLQSNATDGKFHYSGLFSHGSNSCILVATSVYSSKSVKDYGKSIGMVALVVNCRKLSLNVESMPKAADTIYYLLDRNDVVYSSNDGTAVGRAIGDVVTGYDGSSSQECVIDGSSYLISTAAFDRYDGKIVSAYPSQILRNDMYRVGMIDIALLAVSVLLLTIPFSAVLNNIVNPIKKLSKYTNEVKSGNIKYLQKRIALQGHEEVVTLSDNFNGMLDEIESLTGRLIESNTKLYQAELTKNKAELEFLQGQINPHFLYNTLESIKGIALHRGVPEIRDITQALADIFRYSVKGGDMVPLKDEVEILKSYIGIQQIRFSGRFEVEYFVSDDVRNVEIPKMLLQPLAENAIFHGIEMKDGPAHLWVRCTAADGAVEISVRDDGIGMDEETLAEVRGEIGQAPEAPGADAVTKSIGLANVRNRLNLKYGERSRMTIKSELGVGTEIRLILPVGKV